MLLRVMGSAAWTLLDLLVLGVSFGLVMVLADLLADSVRRARTARELRAHEPAQGPGIIPIQEARERTSRVREAVGG